MRTRSVASRWPGFVPPRWRNLTSSNRSLGSIRATLWRNRVAHSGSLGVLAPRASFSSLRCAKGPSASRGLPPEACVWRSCRERANLRVILRGCRSKMPAASLRCRCRCGSKTADRTDHSFGASRIVGARGSNVWNGRARFASRTAAARRSRDRSSRWSPSKRYARG